MRMSYQPLEGGARKTIHVRVTTEHSASSYGQPVLLMPDGKLLNRDSWLLLDYRIERVSRAELELLRRSILAIPEISPHTAAQIDAATPRVGRAEVEKLKIKLSVTLDPEDIEEIREIGDGNASAGVRRLLAKWRAR